MLSISEIIKLEQLHNYWNIQILIQTEEILVRNLLTFGAVYRIFSVR